MNLLMFINFRWIIQIIISLIHQSQVGEDSSYTSFVEIYCEEINPKKIIIFINTDDFNRAAQQKYYILENGNLIKNKVPFEKKISVTSLDRNIPFYRFSKKNSQSFILLRNVIYNIIHPPQKTNSSEFYYTNPGYKLNSNEINKITYLNKKIFLRLKTLSKNCNADLLIINNGWAKLDNIPDTNPNKGFLLNEKFFKNNNFNYFDLAKTDKMKELYKNPYKFIFKEDLHPNKEGANLIFNASKKIIKNFIEFLNQLFNRKLI